MEERKKTLRILGLQTFLSDHAEHEWDLGLESICTFKPGS